MFYKMYASFTKKNLGKFYYVVLFFLIAILVLSFYFDNRTDIDYSYNMEHFSVNIINNEITKKIKSKIPKKIKSKITKVHNNVKKQYDKLKKKCKKVLREKLLEDFTNPPKEQTNEQIQNCAVSNFDSNSSTTKEGDQTGASTCPFSKDDYNKCCNQDIGTVPKVGDTICFNNNNRIISSKTLYSKQFIPADTGIPKLGTPDPTIQKSRALAQKIPNYFTKDECDSGTVIGYWYPTASDSCPLSSVIKPDNQPPNDINNTSTNSGICLCKSQTSEPPKNSTCKSTEKNTTSPPSENSTSGIISEENITKIEYELAPLDNSSGTQAPSLTSPPTDNVIVNLNNCTTDYNEISTMTPTSTCPSIINYFSIGTCPPTTSS